MIQFAYTILYVEDVENSIRFYERSFGLKQKLLTTEKDYGEVHSGVTTLAFAKIALAKSNLQGGFHQSSLNHRPFGIELAFTTNDVKKVLAKAIKEGGVILQEPRVKPWGQEVAYIRDNNGFLIEICTPIKK